MHAPAVVAIFYLAASIAPSFAAPMIPEGDLAKLDPFKTGSSDASTSSETSSQHSETASQDTETANQDSASTSSNSEEESTATPANESSGDTSTTPETTTLANANPATTSSATTNKWRIPQQMSEQAMLQLTSGLVATGLIGVVTATNPNLTHRAVLDRFEAQIDHELAARAHQYRREPLTMLLADLD